MIEENCITILMKDRKGDIKIRNIVERSKINQYYVFIRIKENHQCISEIDLEKLSVK